MSWRASDVISAAQSALHAAADHVRRWPVVRRPLLVFIACVVVILARSRALLCSTAFGMLHT
jgi:hypothetical protein